MKKPLTSKSGRVEIDTKRYSRDDSASEVLPSKLVAILPKRKVGQRGAQRIH